VTAIGLNAAAGRRRRTSAPRLEHPSDEPFAGGPFRGVALVRCLVGDICFHDCDNATRPAVTAVLVYPPRAGVGAAACSQPPAASPSKHYLAHGSLCLGPAKQHCFCPYANSGLPRLPHHRGDAAVSRARRDEWTSSEAGTCSEAELTPGRRRKAHTRTALVAKEGGGERKERDHHQQQGLREQHEPAGCTDVVEHGVVFCAQLPVNRNLIAYAR
jgi:hypothetical protein